MDLNHLHLHVRDIPRAARFYERWFGFREHVWHGEILFLRNDDAFDLALAPGVPAALPSWFHFGFRLSTSERVRDMHRRMSEDGVPVRDLCDEDDLVSFRCSDPEGHSIEIYWE